MPSRLWLDATDPQGTKILSNSGIPPVPAIPNGFGGTPPVIPQRHHTSADARRISVPTKSRKPQQKLKLKPQTQKEPELISGLIDSLSTISFPDPLEAEKLVPPKKIRDPQLRYARSFEDVNISEISYMGGLSTENFDRDDADDGDDDDDIAVSPVIKTSKSSRYDIPKKPSHKWENALGITSLGNKSNASLNSLNGQDVSQELNFKKTSNSNRHSMRRSPSTRSVPFKRDSSDISVAYAKSRNTSGSISDHTLSSRRDGKKPTQQSHQSNQSPNLNGSPIVEGPSVPDRRSSRQFLDMLTPKSNRSRTQSPAIESSSTFENKKLELNSELGKTINSFNLLKEEEEEEDTNVLKRIKELKAKKEQRDLEAMLSPSPDLDSNGLPIAMSLSSNTTKSSKKKKPIPKELDLGPLSLNPNPKPIKSLQPLHPHDSGYLTAESVTPTTDLPINYSFVLQSLDNRPNSQSAPHAFPPDSSKVRPVTAGGKPNTKVLPIPKSFFGKAAALNAEATNKFSKESSSSEKLENEPFSRNTDSLSRSDSAAKRKRWSLSEIGNGLDRRASLRSTTVTFPASNKLASIPSPIQDSLEDVINKAVDDFLNAPRLSQRVKHPQTGRVISFSEVGSKKGNVVFCCVGMGITRFAIAFYDELAITLNLRIITIDRPGVGQSDANSNGTPLSWADDVLLICSKLGISKFSLLAHSAGAIYALATALRVPQHIRGRVHLLAPWIPPSQMAPVSLLQDPPPATQLPMSQRFLRALPAPFLKVANSSFLSTTSASLTPNLGNAPQRRKKWNENTKKSTTPSHNVHEPVKAKHRRPESIMLMDQMSVPSESALSLARSPTIDTFPLGTPNSVDPMHQYLQSAMQPNGQSSSMPTSMLSPVSSSFPGGNPLFNSPEALKKYDESLISAIWDAATTNANPAVDLLVCLEHNQAVGFRYVDITRAVVIHHGAKDTRVPVENVKWLGNAMRRCEVRVLDGEGHGLMANASVMGGVLAEMAKEWQDWEGMVNRAKVGF